MTLRPIGARSSLQTCEVSRPIILWSSVSARRSWTRSRSRRRRKVLGRTFSRTMVFEETSASTLPSVFSLCNRCQVLDLQRGLVTPKKTNLTLRHQHCHVLRTHVVPAEPRDVTRACSFRRLFPPGVVYHCLVRHRKYTGVRLSLISNRTHIVVHY